MWRLRPFRASTLLLGAVWLIFSGTASAGPLVGCDNPGANIHALVVGADHYGTLPALKGGVNDARLLALTLCATRMAEVSILTDGAATRSTILESFRRLVHNARPGDWIFFSYAGHGGRDDPRMSTSNGNPLQGMLLLPDFANSAPQNGERIPASELDALFREVPASINVIFVADACYSGNLSRAVSPLSKGLTYRYASWGPIPVEKDAHPPPPTPGAAGSSRIANLVFVAAALSTQTAPELALPENSPDSQPHGALSFFVAQAISGAAAATPGKNPTLGDFRRYITTAVRGASESLQTADVKFSAGRENDELPFGRSDNVVASGKPATISVWSVGNSPLSGVPGVVQAMAKEKADFAWDTANGDLVNLRLGDLVAQKVESIAQLAGAIAKWRALPALKEMESRHPLQVLIGPGGAGASYKSGQQISIKIAPRPGADLRYLTVVDLESIGSVSFLFPGEGRAGEAGALDPASPQPISDVNVQAPFGADHVIAIATAEKPDRLRAALSNLQGRPAADDALQQIRQALEGKRYALGIAGVYTVP